ncbi:MAG: helix-turn-helix transcriptional regulator [Kiritimatiellae bacterium]|nr:helix-turn-helix transcriptional regulator [Kiritimatiellia bacterium]
MSDAASPIRDLWGAYTDRGTDYHGNPHRVSSLMWYSVLYGDVCVTIEAQEFILRAEQSALISPDRVRAFRCHRKAPGYLWITFENRSLQLEKICDRPLTCTDDMLPDLLALFDEYQKPLEIHTHELTSALLTRLLMGFCRMAGREASMPDGGLASPLNAGMRQETAEHADIFMRRNLHTRCTRSDVARALNVSVPHLSRLYRSATGQTLNARLAELRVERARELLLGTTMSVTSITYEVGLTSFSHFSKVFKKLVGVTPSDYRRTRGHVRPPV